MDLINLKTGETVLVICESGKELEIEDSLKNISNKTIITPQKISEYQDNSHSWILLNIKEEDITNTILGQILKLLKPGAQLIIIKVYKDVDNVQFLLKTCGFTNVQVKENNVLSSKPKYEIGSSSKLNLKKKTVWKLDDDLDEAETIDPDNLLDDDDLIKPDPSSLRVCGTTGKRKACKDCSCGLADELANEAKTGQIIDTTNTPKSSCGSCYLGDAFRCASCPYLGMPAFKPGEKIQLTDTLLKADI